MLDGQADFRSVWLSYKDCRKRPPKVRHIEYWVIPPECDAEFVASMEDVLETYEKPYNPANIFMFCEPLAGWREAFARETKTKADWALLLAELLEGRYVNCEKVTLVCDNLNTHTRGAFYEVFEPSRARALVKRIDWCYTPKHGSWLNIAENELSCITRQCVHGRRIGSIEFLATEIAAWSSDINAKQRGVDWQMRISDARYKLKSVYPKIRVRCTTRVVSVIF